MDLGLDRIQAQLEGLARLPRPYRLALLPAVAFLVLAFYGYFFYLPMHGQIARFERQERELQRQLSEVQAVVENAPAFQQELAGLEQQLAEAMRQLPSSKELPVLLSDIAAIGKDSGLEFKAFRPQSEIQRDFYAEVPIEVEFEGGFHDIARFFDRVSKLPRIVNVNQLEIRTERESRERTRLSVRGRAVTFRFLEPKEQASDQSTGKKKRRRRRRRGGRA